MNNKRLRDLTISPPGGFSYYQKETGYNVTGITWRQLLDRVAQHRRNNNLPIGEDFGNEIEQAICDRLSIESQLDYCDMGARIPKSVAWQQIEGFLKFVGAHILARGALVTQEEAERRAAICARCPLNMGLHGCAVCRSTVEVFRQTILERSTQQDAVLQACGICGCELKTMVHVPTETLNAGGEKDYSINPKCWRLQGGVNESKL